MKLDVPYVELMPYDITAIADICNNGSLDWSKWSFRQTNYSQLISTQTIPFLFLENGNHPEQKELVQEFTQEPIFTTIIQSAIQPVLNYYNGYAVKLMLVKLVAGGTIKLHNDGGITLENVHRCHLPIITNPDVEFEIDKNNYYFSAGQWVEIDNQRNHEVRNKSTIDRIHLMCDIFVPG